MTANNWEELRKEIARMDAENARLQAENAELKQELARHEFCQVIIEELRTENEELKQVLKMAVDDMSISDSRFNFPTNKNGTFLKSWHWYYMKAKEEIELARAESAYARENEG